MGVTATETMSNRLCCCMQRRTAALVIAYIMMLYSCLGLFLDGFAGFARMETGIRALLYTSAALSLVAVFCNLLLHYGTLTRNLNLLRFWLGWSAMMVLFNFIHCIIIFNNVQSPMEYASAFRTLVSLVLIYFMVVVFSFIEQLKREKERDEKMNAMNENGTDADKEPMVQSA